MRQLGDIPCASAGSLTLSYDREGNVCDRNCSICEPRGPKSAVVANYDDALATEAIATFVKLIDLSEFEESRKPRVQAMVALHHFAMHFRDIEFLNLETSKLGQWCLKSLSSSMRELRIAAGYELEPYY
jgi:serine/threonine-protein kinase ATR